MPRPLDPKTRNCLIGHFDARLIEWAGGRGDAVLRFISMFQIDVDAIGRQRVVQAVTDFRNLVGAAYPRDELRGHIEAYFINEGSKLLLTKQQRASALAKARGAAQRRQPPAESGGSKVIKIYGKDADRLRHFASAAGLSQAKAFTTILDAHDGRAVPGQDSQSTGAGTPKRAAAQAPRATTGKRRPAIGTEAPSAGKDGSQGKMHDLFE